MAMTGAALDLAVHGETKLAARTNWSGNYTYSTDKVVEPATTAEVQQAVKATRKLRALGSKHSFNGIADSTVEQISLKRLNSMEVDEAAKTVTVGAGVRYGELAPWLDAKGYALHNLASLPHITVVGACATATHGSGMKNGNLSTAVSAIEFVDAQGNVVQLSRAKDGDRFRGAVVGLGAVGIVTRITLDVQPTFQMRQVVYLDLPFSEVEKNFDAILGAGYSVSLFTDWQKGRVTQVWIKSKVEPGKPFAIAPEFYGAKAATRKMHPLIEKSAENCTDQMGIPGPWYERMPHFRMNFTPSSGQELQTEYFVPHAKGMEAIRAVEELRDEITPHLFITELRTIAADDLWMSPCYKQDSMAVHFTWKPEWPEVKQVLPKIEAKLLPLGAKPHWAKLFTVAPETLQSRYARLKEFKAVAAGYDPQGEFRNAFIEEHLYQA